MMGGWQSAIADARGWARSYVDQKISMLFGWTLTAVSSAMGDGDAVETADGEKAQRPVRRLEPWGLRGRPPKGLRSLWLRLGSSNVVFIGIAPSKGYGRVDLAEGATSLYCKAAGCEVLLEDDGEMNLTSSAGKKIYLNAGNLAVARDTDPVNGSAAFNAWAAVVKAQIIAAGGGDIGATPTEIGKINGGAPGVSA